MTTFSRLALVIQGKIKPCNWIERAFAELASSISSVLPSVSNNDRGKFLGVNASNNNLGWKAIRQVPDVENADKGKFLHANSDSGALEWSEAGGGGISTFTPITYQPFNVPTTGEGTVEFDPSTDILNVHFAGEYGDWNEVVFLYGQANFPFVYETVDGDSHVMELSIMSASYASDAETISSIPNATGFYLLDSINVTECTINDHNVIITNAVPSTLNIVYYQNK